MHFSARTIQILRNFSSIQQAMIFEPGNKLKVVSEQNSILAKATIDTDIDGSFAIYDMGKFLSALSMFDEPTLTCKGSYVEIRQGDEKIDYICAEPSLIKRPPNKEIALPSVDVEVNLVSDTINRMIKGMAITGANVICFTGDGKDLYLEAKTLAATKNQAGTNGAPSYRALIGKTDKKFSLS